VFPRMERYGIRDARQSCGLPPSPVPPDPTGLPRSVFGHRVLRVRAVGGTQTANPRG
jgi:hypothetical protein